MNQIIKLPAVKQLTTFSSATIYRLMSMGNFPRQVKLSERSSGWLLEEVNAWVNNKIEQRGGGVK